MKSKTSLLPCPFCGKAGKHELGDKSPHCFKTDMFVDGKRMGMNAQVVCLLCGASGPPEHSVQAARNLWNRRGEGK